MGTAVMGWGYEGKSVQDLVSDSKAWAVATVVDVRLNPISRKKGLSKTALRASLAEAGVDYLHLPALGNPKDNRAGFAEPGTPAGHGARSRFETEVLDSDAARDALAQVEASSSKGLVLLLCFEASERCCHRSLVLEALRKRAAEVAARSLVAV